MINSFIHNLAILQHHGGLRQGLKNFDKFLTWIEKIGETNWGMAAFFFLLIFLPLAKILIGDQVLANGDALYYHYPVYLTYGQMLHAEQFTLWNPLNFSGFPTFLISVGRFFAPINILFFRLFPALAAYNWLIFFDLFLGALLTSFFLKKLGIPLWGRFVGGLIYVFGQWPFVSDLTIAHAVPLLPLLFIVIYRTVVERRRFGAIMGGLIVGMAWLSANSQWTIMLLTAGGIFTLYLVLRFHYPWRDRLSLLATYALSVTLGSFAGLVQLWPAYVYAALSGRSGGLSYAEATVGALWPTDFVRFILPSFSLPFLASGETLYLGALTLLLLIIGWRTPSVGIKKFFTWLLMGCILISVKFSPLFWVISQLPGYRYFRGPSRWMFLGYFSIAVLAGFGLKAIAEAKGPVAKETVVRIYRWLIGGMVALVILGWFFLHFFGNKMLNFLTAFCDDHLFNEANGVALEFYNKVIYQAFEQLREIISWHNPLFIWPFLFLLISLVFLWSMKRYNLSSKWIVRLIAVIMIGNFGLVTGGYFYTASAKSVFEEPKTATFLKSQPPGKVLAFLSGSAVYNLLTVPFSPPPVEINTFESAFLEPNSNLLYGLENADYYDNIMAKRMSRLLALVGSGRATVGEKLADENISWADKIKKFTSRKPLLDILGIRYIISASLLDEAKFKKIFETKVTNYGLPIYIYENEQARPKVYLADKATTIDPSEELAYQKVVLENLQSREIVVECHSPCLTTSLPTTGTYKIRAHDSGDWKIRVQTEDDRWLVVGENLLPGWEAFIDGNPTEIHYVNSVFMGIAIPSGTHDVRLSFSWAGMRQFTQK